MTTLEKPKSPTLLRQISHYFGGQIAVMAAGFITMPVMMRLMTPEQLGIVSLVTTALMVLTAVGKLGLAPAALRFAGHPAEGQEREESALQSTLLLLSVAASVVCVALVAVAWFFGRTPPPTGSWIAAPYRMLLGENGRLAFLLMLSSALLVPRTLTAILGSLMRTEQRSRTFNAFSITMRYLSLVLALGGFFYYRTLAAYFVGLIVAEGVIVLWFLARWWRSHGLSARLYSTPHARQVLAYGLPLLVFELTSVVLAYCDRYILQYLKGAAMVGHYTAGYNVAELLPAVLVFPVQLAIVPYCFRMWEKDGEERTGEFVAKSTSRYAVAAFPAMALFCAIAPTILLVFASAKYIGSVSVIPWVVAGQVLWQGFFPLVGMGYQVRKKTVAFTRIQVYGLVLNVALNFGLIPVMGIQGAAVATFVTYAAVIVMSGIGSEKHLHVPWEWGSLARAAFLSVLVGALMAWLPLGTSIPAALLRVLLGALIYVRLIIPMDPNARWMALAGVKFLRERGLYGPWVGWLTGMSPEAVRASEGET